MTELTLCTTSQVAARARVDSSTVRLWVKKGLLKPHTTTPGGQYRFDADEVERLLSTDTERASA